MWPTPPQPPEVAWTESDQPSLSEILERWGELTRLEGDAIRRADWPAVESHQSVKRSLRTWMDRARCSHRGPVPPEWRRIEQLEKENLAALKAVRELAETERDTLERSRHNLTRLQRSYVARFSPVWETSA